MPHLPRRLSLRRVPVEPVEIGQARLTDSEALHQSLLRYASTDAGREYLTENVIGDGNLTFGIEIEFSGTDPNKIASDLYSLQMSSSPYQEGYHSSKRQEDKWIVESDATVAGEVISPVLTDTAQTWQDLRVICQVMKNRGARTTIKTGGHIHVGLKSGHLHDSKEAMRTLMAACIWSEDLLYRLGGGVAKRGQHRGSANNYHYCRPFGRHQAHALRRAKNIEEISQVSSGGVRLRYAAAADGGGTVEFRFADSFLDPERLQAHIILCCALVRFAATERMDLIPAESVPLGTHKAQGGRDDRLLREFADLVLQDPRHKTKIYSLHSRTRWQNGVQVGV